MPPVPSDDRPPELPGNPAPELPGDPAPEVPGDPVWLAWARRLQAIAQTGLHFEKDVFDGERYREVARIAAEILAGHSAAEAAFVERFFEAEVGYATPKLDLRAAVFRDGRILLVRERSDGLWALPGGWADVGETPRQGIEKEVLEEAGLAVRAVKLLALYDQRGRGARPHPLHILKAFFRCEIVGEGPQAGKLPEPRPGLETLAAGFFAEDALPPLSLGRTSPGQLARLFAHGRDPGLPADFD
jgi:ADP-ribose pyrophosphatase YjhB (NUDIX family)